MNAQRDFRPIVKTHLHTSPIVVKIKSIRVRDVVESTVTQHLR